MSFEKIVRDIKALKIKGAENIAKNSILALGDVINKSKVATKYKLIEELKESKETLINANPNEPCTRNTLKYILTNLDVKDIISLKTLLDERIKKVQQHFIKSDKKISETGANRIKDGMVVFTHNYSSSVISILKKAKNQGRKFQVYTTETRPKFQGRLTALELSKHKILVKVFVDSAAKIAMKEADLFLFGANAIRSDGKVINKIGTELFAEVADKYDIPTYSCTNSWKFDPKTTSNNYKIIEQGSREEVWVNPPKNVEIANPLFENVKPELITGIISELGVYRPHLFIEILREKYPWMWG